jgi:predicted ribosomally synthesized peptide with SipW-like signal peptide
MNKILFSLAIIAVAGTAAVGITRAYFSDVGTSTGNTFTAGTLDLKVDGQDALIPYSVADLKPGDSRGTSTYAITNTGSIPGVLSMKVKNVVTDENEVLGPEIKAGDAEDVRLDPDHYSIAASGYGELLDQVMLTFWVDDTAGQRPAPFDWQDTKYWNGYPDESSHYSLPVNTDLMAGKTWKSGPYTGQPLILNPGQTAYIGIGAQFISDTSISYGWILDGIPNNAAMGDDFKFDLEIGLNQVI